MITTEKKTTKRYVATDAKTGRKVYKSVAVIPACYSLKKSAKCPSLWTTTASSWYGDMQRAVAQMSKQYGKPVLLVEDGEVEVFEVFF